VAANYFSGYFIFHLSNGESTNNSLLQSMLTHQTFFMLKFSANGYMIPHHIGT